MVTVGKTEIAVFTATTGTIVVYDSLNRHTSTTMGITMLYFIALTSGLSEQVRVFSLACFRQSE